MYKHKILTTNVYIISALLLLFSSCVNIKLISDYDENIDQSITEFQRKMETFLTFLERNEGKPEATYDQNISFYDEVKVDLSAIKIRAAAQPKNNITIQQIDLLLENVSLLEELHEVGISSRDIMPLRTAFNSSCTAIIKLELSKKRGEK